MAVRAKASLICILSSTHKRRQVMPLVNLIVVLIVVGVLLWMVNNFLPMDRKIKSILNLVVVIGVIVWLLQVFGIIGPIGSMSVGG
jgi:hypothetical protein